MTAAPATGSAAAATRGMSSPIDAPALDAAVSRYRTLLVLIRAHYWPERGDIPPHLLEVVRKAVPYIADEYRRIMAKERG